MGSSFTDVAASGPLMLPLVPGYLSYVTGLAGTDLKPVADPLPPTAGSATATATRVRVWAGRTARRKAAQRTQPEWRAGTVEPPKPLHVLALTGLRTLRTQAGDDLVPVEAFLGGKLASHALLGALLGAVGAAFQLSPTVQVWTQLTAGGLIIAFGLAQLGVDPFKRFTVRPPAAWSRFVRGQARSQAAFAPALLGFFTILSNRCGDGVRCRHDRAVTSGCDATGTSMLARPSLRSPVPLCRWSCGLA